MATLGYATLSVIPSLQNAQAALEKETKGPLSKAGKTGGKQFGASFKSQFQSNLKGLAGPLTAAFAGLSAKKLLGDSIKAFTDLNLQVVQFRRLAGGSVEDASRLRSAIQLSGVDIAKSATSLTIFSKNLGKAAGDEAKTAKLTGLLGTSFVDASGNVESLTTLLPRVAEKFSAMEDGVAKTTLATTLFGRAGVAMIPFLNKGADGIAELTAQSDKLGLTLSQADLDSFGEYRKASRELSASFQGLKVEAGRELLPTLTSLTTFTTENAVPALKDLGSGVRAAYEAYKGLPGPVKDAAKAFILLKTASALGLTAAVTGTATRAASAMTSLRLQTMFAGDAFRAQRASSGILTASLAAVSVGAKGAAIALSGLARTILPLAAITAAISLYSKYKQKQQDVKDQVDALTSSIDAQTGAIAENGREQVRKALLEAGAYKAAEDLGISLTDVTNAALGNEDALRRVNAALKDNVAAQVTAAGTVDVNNLNDKDRLKSTEKLRVAYENLTGAIGGQNDVVSKAKENARLLAAGNEKAADNTDGLSSSTGRYATSLDSARFALQKLINKEKERADKANSLLGDRIGIQQAKADAAKDLRFAKPGFNLDILGGDQKSRDRLNTLRDLASTFNNADPKVQNAKGIYKGVRDEFDKLALKAGASKDEVKTLRDQLLLVPKTATTDFRTPGLRQAQSEVDRLIASIDKINANPRSLVPLYRADRADRADTPGAPQKRGGGNRGGSTADLGTGGRPSVVYQYNGPVTYTDEEEGRRRARNHDRRAGGDGVRRR